MYRGMKNSNSIAQAILQDREKGASRLEAEYRDRLYSAAYAMCHDANEAEDLVFRTIERVLDKIETYEEQDSFYNWMCVILQNLYRDSRRSKMARGTMPIGGPSDMEAFATPVDADTIVEAVDADIARRALEKIPPRMREVLILHYFMDMPVKQIARTLMVSPGTVMSRMHYARRALAKRLGAQLRKPTAALIAAALFFVAAASVVNWIAGDAEQDRKDAAEIVATVEFDMDYGIAQDQTDPDAAPTSSSNAISTRKGNTAMKNLTLGGLFRKAAKTLSSISVSIMAANAAYGDDPYIESDGSAGISTGYFMKTDSRVEVDFAMAAVDSTTVNKRLFGAEDTDGKGGLVLSVYMPGDNKEIAFRIGNGTGNRKEYWSGVAPAVGHRHTAIFDIYHDELVLATGGVTNWMQTASGTIGTIARGCTQPLALFAYPDGANRPIAGPAKAKIYGCKIFESDVLVHDFEPCEKDGIAGFMDRVGGGFIAKGGHWNNFSAGGSYVKYTSPYVATPPNNSDTYIDTGYHVVSNTCVALDCAPISDWAGTICYAFGAAGGNNDTAAGNFNIFHAFFRHDTGFGARTLNTSGGWIQGVTSTGSLTNGVGGAVKVRRTFTLDTVVDSKGLGKTHVKTANETNGEKGIHALKLTKPGYHTLCLASSHGGSGTKSSVKIYGCKVSEKGTAVRDYVPAIVNGVAGLQDRMTGGTFVPAAAGTLTAGGFVPSATGSTPRISFVRTATLTASAPGASSYRWFRNGKPIPGGENGTLTVSWRPVKNSPSDSFRAASVSSCAGETLLSGLSNAVSVEYLARGTMLILR